MRVKNPTAPQATLTYPGGAQVVFGYTGEDLISVTDVSTSRTWSYTFDAKHNPLTVRTPLEATGVPLIEYQHLFDTNGLIDQTTARVRQADGSLGDPVETQFNDLNLPTQVKAYARAGSGLPDQIMQLQYDGGTLSVGNLTKIIEAFGTAQQPETNLFYDTPDGAWGLPTRVRNEVNGESLFDYHNTHGRLLTAASPQNLVVASNHPDRPTSVTAVAYNGDDLPSQVLDPLGHPVNIAYNAAAVGSPELVITYTYGDNHDGSVRLDGMGRPKEARDERDILTQWTWTKWGELASMTRAAGTVDAAVTQYFYDSRLDLVSINPPNPDTPVPDAISFDYRRHEQNGALTTPVVYEGQVVKTTFADGTYEVVGYNGAGELAWRRKPDGTIVTLQRDELHRVKQIDYPASGGNPAFSVITTFDGFGRVVSTSDLSGTTTATYDSLNRPLVVTPPSPQKALTYSYSPDTALQRWTTSVAVAGVGTYQYREDSKGRLTEVVNPFNQSFVTQFDKDGKPIYRQWWHGGKEYLYYTGGGAIDNRDLLLKREVFQNNGPLIESTTYSYLFTGHLAAECSHTKGTHHYGYNSRYELVGEADPYLGTILYTLDKNGNRLVKTQSSPYGGVTVDYYGVDAANKLLWVNRGTNAPPTAGQAAPYTLYVHDTNGRVTQRDRRYLIHGGMRRTLDYSWDGDDRLRSVKEGGVDRQTASYGGDGLRVSKWDYHTGQHDYSWGPGGVLHDSNQNTTHTPGWAQRKDGVDRGLVTDYRGSFRFNTEPTFASAITVYQFDAFGWRSDRIDEAYATPYQFGGAFGYETEAMAVAANDQPGLELIYIQQRYYDPAVGRWLTPDPIGLAGGLNIWAYCGGDPVNFVDPTGLLTYTREQAVVDGVGGIFSFLGGLGGGVGGFGLGAALGSPTVVGAPALAYAGGAAGAAFGATAGWHVGRQFGVGLVGLGQSIASIYRFATGSRGSGGSGGGSHGGGDPREPVYDVIETDKGPVEFAAGVCKEGDRLIITDIKVYPVGKPNLPLGPKEALRVFRGKIRELAQQHGVTKVRLGFHRTGGATPGRDKVFDYTIR
jgi:RHS repeat-associated protein